MSFTSLALRIFYPRVDTPQAALSAANNAALAGAIKALDRLAWGIFIVTSGAPVEAALLSLAIVAVLGLLTLMAMSGSRIAIALIIAWILFEIIAWTPPLWHLGIDLLSLILAIGGLRGAFALAAFKRELRKKSRDPR